MYPIPLSLGRRIVKLSPEIWVVHGERPTQFYNNILGNLPNPQLYYVHSKRDALSSNRKVDGSRLTGSNQACHS